FNNNVCSQFTPAGSQNPVIAAGQLFAFSVLANGFPGALSTCMCKSPHFSLNPDPVDCGSGSNASPLRIVTSGATGCIFEYQKTGSDSQVINASGPPSTINAAILDSATCPVATIETDTVRVCDGALPTQKSFKLQKNPPALAFQFSEGDCRNTLHLPPPGST